MPGLHRFFSPYPASVLPHHGLPFVASEGLGELRHIGHHIVDPVFVQRMRVREQDCAHHFRTQVAAPDVGVGQEEALQCGQAVIPFGIEALALRFQIRIERG